MRTETQNTFAFRHLCASSINETSHDSSEKVYSNETLQFLYLYHHLDNSQIFIAMRKNIFEPLQPSELRIHAVKMELPDLIRDLSKMK